LKRGQVNSPEMRLKLFTVLVSRKEKGELPFDLPRVIIKLLYHRRSIDYNKCSKRPAFYLTGNRNGYIFLTGAALNNPSVFAIRNQLFIGINIQSVLYEI